MAKTFNRFGMVKKMVYCLYEQPIIYNYVIFGLGLELLQQVYTLGFRYLTTVVYEIMFFSTHLLCM